MKAAGDENTGHLLAEHSSVILVAMPKGDVNAKMKVFYNPVMKSNRNISILLLNSIAKKNMKIADVLAGSGIRSLRFLKELKKGKISRFFVNDAKENFPAQFKKHLELNKIPHEDQKRIEISNEDASLFLLHHGGFDYIDIDPFGSPNPFLAAAIARISRNGILAVTATDTAALTGTYVKSTRRKYWAESLKNYLMHETGLRILIRKVQLQGIQFEKALVPILSYHKDHYFRIYFTSSRSKKECDVIVKQHKFFLYCRQCAHFETSDYNKGLCACGKEYQFAGPLWAGKLFDKNLIGKMVQNNFFSEEQKLLDIIRKEAAFDVVGFYDLHELAKKYKIQPPKIESVLKKIKGARTHFSDTGIKSEKGIAEILKAIN